MLMNADPLLSLMIFIPLLGMVVVLGLPSRAHDAIRWTATAFSVPPLLLAVVLLARFAPGAQGFQFVHRATWIPAFNIDYFVGVDGISITMIVLTALLCFICMIASFGIDKGVKGYYALFLLLETGMLGVFCALDFFLFFVFWELMLLPMYFLIGIWGGPRREYAAIKFFLYTLLGSVFILIAILGFYFTDISDVIAPPDSGGKRPTAIQKTIDKMRLANPSLDVQAAEKSIRAEITQKYKNSFDLVALQRAGEEAARVIKQTDTLEKAVDDAKASGDSGAVKKAEAALEEGKAKHGGQ